MIPVKAGMKLCVYGNINNDHDLDVFYIPINSDGGSGNSNASNSANMSVSTFGDTLTINGQSIIVPGLSYLNVVPTFGSVTDASGNTYTTLQIGSQEWMAENLRTTKYSDGSDITFVSSGSQNTTTGYYLYLSNYNYVSNYGMLYNGYAMQDPRNVCPSGWHVPSALEWDELGALFGHNNNSGEWDEAGGALKSKYLFQNPNTGATNESYMSLVPGGFEDGGTGASTQVSQAGHYWSSDGGNMPRYYRVNHDSDILGWGTHLLYRACSIRCVKD